MPGASEPPGYYLSHVKGKAQAQGKNQTLGEASTLLRCVSRGWGLGLEAGFKNLGASKNPYLGARDNHFLDLGEALG